MPDPVYFFGLRFWNSGSEELLKLLDREGGMLAVPSAPSLAQAAEDALLMDAYRTSDWSVMDGGYVASLVRLFGRNIRRISGLQLIEKLVAPDNETPVPLRSRKVLWVVPNTEEESRITTFLNSCGFSGDLQSYYLAPYYRTDSDFRDTRLIELVHTLQPDWIVLCLGGGRQEKLGYFLRDATHTLARKPVILCTGAAIAFFTGGQAKIPKWADRMYLGWFLRICRQPSVFLPRYAKAFWHFPLALWRQRGHWFDHPAG